LRSQHPSFSATGTGAYSGFEDGQSAHLGIANQDCVIIYYDNLRRWSSWIYQYISMAKHFCKLAHACIFGKTIS
jgi:hypothetical protein